MPHKRIVRPLQQQQQQQQHSALAPFLLSLTSQALMAVSTRGLSVLRSTTVLGNKRASG